MFWELGSNILLLLAPIYYTWNFLMIFEGYSFQSSSYQCLSNLNYVKGFLRLFKTFMVLSLHGHLSSLILSALDFVVFFGNFPALLALFFPEICIFFLSVKASYLETWHLSKNMFHNYGLFLVITHWDETCEQCVITHCSHVSSLDLIFFYMIFSLSKPHKNFLSLSFLFSLWSSLLAFPSFGRFSNTHLFWNLSSSTFLRLAQLCSVTLKHHMKYNKNSCYHRLFC